MEVSNCKTRSTQKTIKTKKLTVDGLTTFLKRIGDEIQLFFTFRVWLRRKQMTRQQLIVMTKSDATNISPSLVLFWFYIIPWNDSLQTTLRDSSAMQG
jgi:hypothetical protein